MSDNLVYIPICFSHSFSPAWTDKTFHAWREKVLVPIEDLYECGRFASFSILKEKFELPQTHFFRYLQIRHYVQSKIPNFETLPQKRVVFDLLKNPPDSSHLVSRFVGLFDNCNKASTIRIWGSWKVELDIELSEVRLSELRLSDTSP